MEVDRYLDLVQSIEGKRAELNHSLVTSNDKITEHYHSQKRQLPGGDFAKMVEANKSDENFLD